MIAVFYQNERSWGLFQGSIFFFWFLFGYSIFGGKCNLVLETTRVTQITYHLKSSVSVLLNI